MIPYAVVDLHCDTLTAGKSIIDDRGCAMQISSIPEGLHYGQFYAVFIPDEIRGMDAVKYYERFRDRFYGQMEQYSDRVSPCRAAEDMDRAWDGGKVSAFLSVENGSVLTGDPERAALLAEDGVKAVTLVWNGENELGSGHDTENGLTAAGKAAVRALEKHRILVDASHLNDRGFYDFLDTASRPFLATHSNCRSVCPHKRNLTDEMIRDMISRQCLIGLNYYVRFLAEDGRAEGFEPLFLHIARFLELGAENCLCLGSDYDGAEVPECVNSPAKLPSFYDYLLSRGVDRETADKIFWKNARRFLHDTAH